MQSTLLSLMILVLEITKFVLTPREAMNVPAQMALRKLKILAKIRMNVLETLSGKV